MDAQAVTGAALDWYKGRRVFLTGHTGFKGAWMTLWLQQLGAEVTGFALPAEPDSLFVEAAAHQGIVSIEDDIRNKGELDSAIRAARPEIIIHMAAQSLVRPSYDDPCATFDTNVMGTANLLNSARGLPDLRAIVVVTSDKCYENDGASVAFVEGDAMGGSDPYSASKGCAELVAASFRRSYFTGGDCALATARAGNVIGGGDWAIDRIIPDLMRGAVAGGATMIRRPDATRPWQHVLEPVRGYLMLGHAAATRGARFASGWNFGPRFDDAVPVRDIVERVRSLWPSVVANYAEAVTGPAEARTLMLDCHKAAAELGWRPIIDLDAALALTVAWYRGTAAVPGSGGDLARAQVGQYCQSARAQGAGTHG